MSLASQIEKKSIKSLVNQIEELTLNHGVYDIKVGKFDFAPPRLL